MRYLEYFASIFLIFGGVMTSCNEQDDKYTVYFISNGGSEVAPQIVNEGGRIIKPDDPIRDKHTFLWWYRGEWVSKWNFDTDLVTSDMTLSARWEQSLFTVTFFCYSGCEISPQNVQRGEKATEPSPAPTKEGYIFDGWYLSGDSKKWDFNTYLTSDLILNAKWVSEEDNEGIEGISFENYPRVDGATSTNPLNWLVACKLLGIHYEWGPSILEYVVWPVWNELPEEYGRIFIERIKNSQTHGAFMNLINGDADIILTHRTISPDEKAYADAIGVTLIETPIASDAFVFVVNLNNPVKSLTVEQVQKIYTGEITNWSQVGGHNVEMKVFTRPRNSGSEEVFRTLVMKDLVPLDFQESEISTMWGVFPEVTQNVEGICYSFNAYKELQVRSSDNSVPKIAINNIFPDKITVQNRTYPFISEVHVAIRSDLDRNSMAYRLYEWLQSEQAKWSIVECGFVPK